MITFFLIYLIAAACCIFIIRCMDKYYWDTDTVMVAVVLTIVPILNILGCVALMIVYIRDKIDNNHFPKWLCKLLKYEGNN